jgi:hypothetical protein
MAPKLTYVFWKKEIVPSVFVLDCSLCSPDGTRATKNYFADAGFPHLRMEKE